MKILGIGMLHPARVLRNGHAHDPAQLVYLERAFDLLDDPAPQVCDPTVPPPGAILAPTMRDLIAWGRGPVRDGIVIDVEDVGVMLGIGLTRITDLVHLWVPFRRGADLYWDEATLPNVVAWVDAILGDPNIPKWFHNVMADVPWLVQIGFHVDGIAGDTMLMSHVAWPE